jgi:hypothetical protein
MFDFNISVSNLSFTGNTELRNSIRYYEVICSLCGEKKYSQKWHLQKSKLCSNCRNLGTIEYRIKKNSKKIKNGCIIWTGFHNRHLYPSVFHKGKSIRLSHYFLEKKLGRKIKDGFWALHSCDNRACINPDHIYEGTREDNTRDAIKFGTFKKEKFCPKLNANLVIKIKQDLINNKVHDVAKKYSLSISYVYYIKQGKSWSHIQLPGSEQISLFNNNLSVINA